jgi:hypothetical protein
MITHVYENGTLSPVFHQYVDVRGKIGPGLFLHKPQAAEGVARRQLCKVVGRAALTEKLATYDFVFAFACYLWKMTIF